MNNGAQFKPSMVREVLDRIDRVMYAQNNEIVIYLTKADRAYITTLKGGPEVLKRGSWQGYRLVDL